MKLPALFALGAFVFSSSLFAAAPAGDVVELHGCELYTGGCTASAQSTLGGRSLLRVWHFSAGENLAGLSVAALETADVNLAETKSEAKSALVYFPKNASTSQREALRAWLAANHVKQTAERTAEIRFAKTDGLVSVAIGDAIQVRTRALEHCGTGSCGEALWYEPRSQVDRFTVLVNDESNVREPALQLDWREHGLKTVFLGHFGAKVADPTFSLAFAD